MCHPDLGLGAGCEGIGDARPLQGLTPPWETNVNQLLLNLNPKMFKISFSCRLMIIICNMDCIFSFKSCYEIPTDVALPACASPPLSFLELHAERPFWPILAGFSAGVKWSPSQLLPLKPAPVCTWSQLLKSTSFVV